MNFKLLFSSIILIVGANLALAQSTGSFQQSIVFDEPDYDVTRTLYFYVPTDYDASQSYKLVVGFRGGPNSNAGQFRDQLTFLSDSLNAIILCPENEAHFWNEEGLTKQLFQYSVDTAMAQYNIDPDFIYLTGLSYGGRHAVIVSMDTDAGPIPGLRGVIPFAAGSEADEQPNYEAISDFPPACICIGLSDSQNFINVANNLHDDIQENGGASILNEIPGVGHTVVFDTFPEEMMECFDFIESQYETTSVGEVIKEDDTDINVFPNPATEFVEVRMVDTFKPNNAYITNAAGKIIRELNVNDRRIDISNLPAGIVTMVWIGDDKSIVKRIAIKH